MKVILTTDVKGHGKKGDIVTVSDGYGANYLIPNKLATPASNTNLNLNSQAKASQEHADQVLLNNCKETASKLDVLTLTLKLKCGENGKTFGSVTNKEISDELSKLGFNIDKKKIDFSPAKTLGSHNVKIKLHQKVTATIAVNIVSL